ncbi:DUF3397 domain-containing protein [Enterococcus thailandicus]|uniref:DUF3397 domain-containing protein n=1 Tax=Enterococcus thailandicus TaxID=417368 RepID=UPI00372D6B6B
MGTFTPIVLFWYIFPAIVLFGCQFLVRIFALNRRFNLKAPDLSVPFLWAGMHELSRNMGTISVLPFFIISVLLLGICIAVFQAYYYEEIVYSRYLKMTWRLTFLLTIILYLVLIVFNIVSYL